VNTTSATSVVLSERLQALQAATAGPLEFLTQSEWARRAGEPGIADFVVGNPHEMPLAGFVSALRRHVEPRSADWFAYKMSEPAAQESIASALSEQHSGERFAPADVLLTTGAFAGLTVVLKTIIDVGDEVLFVSPPWFFYTALIVAEGGAPVRVCARADDFDLDLAAIEAAITPRTRAIIVNSPNNPTGRIYPPRTLAGLGEVLTRASRQNGRDIFLLSDEAYRRIIYDARAFTSPAAYYPHSFVIYTYGKQLLTPGQRLGYVALPPRMPAGEREHLRHALTLAQVASGYAFPNALLQYAVPELEELSVDVAHLQRKRDRLVSELRRIGYQVAAPEGTFYLLPRSPIADDGAFVEHLAQHDVFVLPGSVVELPGYFRMSLTATDEMIERALPTLTRAIDMRRA
jgi:aspartate aminotransferase